ncbi:hypothetical protein [Breoghania sp.]|uniref:hypothetical protein n=1 Tax=Breoghania sp. TaxID=2065378 RepID=UPI002AAAC194|nr:hypothetical protein [Breoghania sp.]
MYPFFWPSDINAPFAGGNFQTISPTSGWFSTTINYKGSPEIERRIAENVASSGRQLGIITEALLELAGNRKGEKLDRLREIDKQIREIKERSTAQLRREASAGLQALAERDKNQARHVAEALLRELA